MLNNLFYKHSNKLALIQSKQFIFPKTSALFINQRKLFQTYTLASQPAYHIHSFRPFYSFSSSKPKKDQKIQQQQQQQQNQQYVKNVQTRQKEQSNQTSKEDDSKKKEYELIFAKISENQEQKFDPEQQLEEFEKKVKTTNLNVLKRELFNDSMQLPIKYLAYMLAGHASVGTFLAELCRSSIDAINHLMLFLVNYINVQPTKQFPYGREKVKFLVVFIPSLLFFFFGGYTIYSSYVEYFNAAPQELAGGGDNLYSILLYLASFGIEISVIAYNIRDSIKMQSINTKETNQKLSIFQIISSLVSKKDPLLQAVLYENMITLMSMSVPLIVAMLTQKDLYSLSNLYFFTDNKVCNMVYPSYLPELIGQNIIGAIQLFLGYHLGTDTTRALLDKSVDEETMQDIHDEILKNPYVKSVSEAKGIMSGSVRFKYHANIEYDFEALTEDVMEDYRQMSTYIVYSKDYKDRQEELEELMESLPLRLLREINRQEKAILESIKRKYPQCDYFDINIDTETLYTFLHEDQKIKNSFHQELDSDDELKVETEEEKIMREWILSESDRILQMKFTKKREAPVKTSDQLYYENLHFKINAKHYSNSIHPVFYKERAILFEKQRSEIIQHEQNLDDNHRNNDDPL